MTQLASGGDAGLFEASYLGHMGDDAVLFVGTNAGAAIAYLCDPGVGSRWFAGTAANGTIDLKDAKGGHITGTATSGRLDATLAGVSGYDGAVSLAKSLEDFRVAREGNVPAGQLVGGLVRDGDVIRGVLNVTASGLPNPSGATPSKTPITIGLQAKIGSTIDMKVSTSPKLTSEAQRVVDSSARDVIARLANTSPGCDWGSCSGGDKVWNIVAAIVVVVVACMLAAVAFGATSQVAVAVVIQAATIVGDQIAASPSKSLDVTTGAFLTKSLEAFLQGVKVAVSANPTASPLPVKAPSLGTLTFGALNGS